MAKGLKKGYKPSPTQLAQRRWRFRTGSMIGAYCNIRNYGRQLGLSETEISNVRQVVNKLLILSDESARNSGLSIPIRKLLER